ncbi:MAG: hypothetical protein RLZZ123_1448 [Pseudomonadota bacterium]
MGERRASPGDRAVTQNTMPFQKIPARAGRRLFGMTQLRSMSIRHSWQLTLRVRRHDNEKKPIYLRRPSLAISAV